MKTLNKSLLAAAVIGAIALPGLSSAATLQYDGSKQITYARDLGVSDGITLETPLGLRLTADGFDSANLDTIRLANDKNRLTVKVTLTDGATFDSTSNAADLVAGFLEGAQTGGSGNPIGGTTGGAASQIVGTPSYSGDGHELTFTYDSTGDGNQAAAGYFLQIQSMKIRNLLQNIGEGRSVGAEITVQNADGQVVLAAKRVIARSQWGLELTQEDNVTYFPHSDKRIDVGSEPQRRVLFSPGPVGGSATADLATRTRFNAGGFTLDISKAQQEGSAASHTTTYINNFNAVAGNIPQYNVVSEAVFTVKVTGTNLSAFAGGRAWLDGPACAGTGAAIRPLNIATGAPEVAEGTIPVTHGLVNNLMKADDSDKSATVYVCLAAGAGTTASPAREMLAQELSGEVSVDYNLSTQRKNPPARSFRLSPLLYNGATIYFQNVNPGGNPNAQSFLRLTSHNSLDCPVFIDAKDDQGRLSEVVELSLVAHSSEQLNIDALESGVDNRTPARFTSGLGKSPSAGSKWYVRLTFQCTNVTATAWNRNAQTLGVTDLNPQEGIGVQWSAGAKINP